MVAKWTLKTEAISPTVGLPTIRYTVPMESGWSSFCSGCYSGRRAVPDRPTGQGSVLAEDILDESLAFLWIRAFLHHQSNIRVIHGDPDDPHLPKRGVDAVLIANSYHEFTKPLAILDHTFRALRSEGRLVVLDRGPRSYQGESREIQMQRYQIAASK